MIPFKQLVSQKFSKKMRNLRAKSKNYEIRKALAQNSPSACASLTNQENSGDESDILWTNADVNVNAFSSQKRLLSSNTLNTVTSSSKIVKNVDTITVKSNLTAEQIDLLHKKLIEITSKTRFCFQEAKKLLRHTYEYRRDNIKLSNQTFDYLQNTFPYLLIPELVGF
jgi:hypothetical protein